MAKTSNDLDTKCFALRMPRDLYKRVRYYAAEHDLFVTAAINEIILKFLDSQSENS